MFSTRSWCCFLFLFRFLIFIFLLLLLLLFLFSRRFLQTEGIAEYSKSLKNIKNHLTSIAPSATTESSASDSVLSFFFFFFFSFFSFFFSFGDASSGSSIFSSFIVTSAAGCGTVSSRLRFLPAASVTPFSSVYLADAMQIINSMLKYICTRENKHLP